MNHAAIKLPALAVCILLACYGSVMRAAQLEAQPRAACCSKPNPNALQEIEFPYFSVSKGFHSRLWLVSRSPQSTKLTIAIHGLSGETLQAPSQVLAPFEKLDVDVETLLDSLGADVSGSFSSGSLSVRFEGTGTPLAGQLTLSDAERSLNYESIMVQDEIGYTLLGKELHGLWWGLGGVRDAQIMVANTTAKPVIADLFLDYHGVRHASSNLSFMPYEGKVLSVTKLLAEQNVTAYEASEGGITIVSSGDAPALYAEGRIVDLTTGFSTTLHFPAQALQKKRTLHAGGLPVGTPSESSPYAGLGRFVPHVVVRNLIGEAQTIRLTFEYPGDSGPQEVALPSFILAGYTTRDVSLESLGVPLPPRLPFCSLRIEYSGPPRSVEAEVPSLEEKGNLAIDSLVANEGNGYAGSGAYPWRLDGGAESTLFLTNMGEDDCRIGLKVRAGDVEYFVTKVKLAAHETLAINLRELRDRQTPDLDGNKIPAAAVEGLVVWSRLDSVPVMGRLVVIERSQASTTALGNNSCFCPASFKGVLVYPKGFNALPGETCQHTALGAFLDCNGTDYRYDLTDVADWSSGDPSVLVVNNTDHKGLVTGIGGGSTRVMARYTGRVYTLCRRP
jgi:hypothetical protein